MSNSESDFLFASLDSKTPTTIRKLHIRRLYDILQLCIQRRDYKRARRAWSILVRCKEISWKVMWITAVLLVSNSASDSQDSETRTVDFMRSMMLRRPEEKQTVLRELVLRLIQAGQYRQALDELDLYLPSFPYQDNPVLHAYAGLIALYLSQLQGERRTVDLGWLRVAQTHLERSKSLDPENTVVQGFLDKMPSMSQSSNERTQQQQEIHESDEDTMNVDNDEQRRKRVRA